VSDAVCVRAMSSAFDYVQCAVTGAGAAHQVHENVEDAFIDEMAMGPLLWKNARHKLLAGSIEGIVAELIQVVFAGHLRTSRCSASFGGCQHDTARICC